MNLNVAALRHAVRHPVDAVGKVLVQRQYQESLRFSESDRFGHELPDRRSFFRHTFHYLRFNGIKGDYAEFGSFGASTFRMAYFAAELTGHDAHLWSFDSFEGLPEQADQRDVHPEWRQGTMATGEAQFHALCQEAGMPKSRYSTVPGFYNASLTPDAPGARPDRVAFAYVDCDLYSSTVDVLAFLESRLAPSSVIGFDDYYCNNPDGPSGERRAARDHFAHSQWQLLPYIQYGWAGMSFIIEERSEGGPVVGW